ncbi:MAG: PAS domain-containing protein [Ferrovibrio sp.]|uniref:PAS domain-containing protein n=1 Tax=Ferrovibrio sp. TaxID=1917215 RepID=UPI00262756A9|nr:PAS domain-containing protein [Ferrovibrio sp.]MCW0233912.1 PAS domain-containing protein [Ferrovibrio sp.]
MDRPLSSLLETLTLPGHRAATQHWLALYRAGDNRVPMLHDLDPLQFSAALPDIWIVDLDPDGRFRFHLLGQNMIDWHGSNPKGLSFEDIYTPEMLPVVTAMVRRVIEQPAVVYQKAQSVTRNRSLPVPIERIALPLADAEGRVRHLFGVTVFMTRDGHGSGPLRTELQVDDWYPVETAET